MRKIEDLEMIEAPDFRQKEEQWQRQNAELARLVEELTAARAAAVKSSEAKAAFLATMSHEIRTPLSAVVSASILINDGQLSAEQREYALTIRNSANALIAVVDRILDFAKIDAGSIELEARVTQVSSVVEDVFDMLADKARKKGIELSYVLEPPVPGEVVCDPIRLRQVLLNLVANAANFTDSGSIRVRVTSSALEAGACTLRFDVTDTGSGIDPSALGLLFQPFRQVPSDEQEEAGGTGLGLAISRRLVERMGGRIWVTSDVGMGSTFTFTLPVIAHAAKPAAPMAREAGAPLVLYAGAHGDLHDRIMDRLPGFGYRVRVAHSAEHALALIGGPERVDVLVVDSALADAPELARTIRALPGPDVPPVVLLATVGMRLAAADADLFEGRVTEPVRVSALAQTIKYALDNRTGATVRGNAGEPLPDGAGDGAFRDLRVLIVDDNSVNRYLAIRMFGYLGVVAAGVASGAAAIEELGARNYDAVFMDLNMPRMDGAEAARKIRESGLAQTPWIVALTANATHEARERCLAAGMDDFVSKPFVIDDLKRALSGLPAAQGVTRPERAPSSPVGSRAGKQM